MGEQPSEILNGDNALQGNEVAFAGLLNEWNQIQNTSAAQVSQWDCAFATLAEEEGRLRERGEWVYGPADFFGVLEVSRDEVRHSRVIAWLLDPCRPHGLGVRCLRGVLDAAGIEGGREALGRAQVRCEVQLNRGRLDIVVASPSLYLVIENKVDSDEGDQQCDDYFDHTRRREPKAQFIFLSPDGRQTRSKRAEVRAAFKPLSYSQLGAAIRDALRGHREGGPGRYVAEDYLRTLEREFR